ncbi:anhydro-N-acetylmuramic acid kinase [Meiothermus hypogaeus]|uniref:Anhydro-N-acetylmuramic acid kinase n=2 Tax=Meiothermus hypogaeus TaxID=884155 RepID=A0A511R1I2_9DEIN|nr:anhydro-N-acetylmuramic acid kinase [Meiothermus hypogaeus]RIH76168.1 Anhydro-N-acetylmuramic acid kinase [Meiothermus hypogaeus]GEM83470.1 anhydro-N-acetylmuramic acid kinase [Meiothermus hypogaeus NBRC 106114]
MRVLGLMSGTSVDAVDLLLAELDGRPPKLRWHVLEHKEVRFPPDLRAQIIRTLKSQATTREVALLHHALGRFYAEAAAPFKGRVGLVASHGQTVWHEPPQATLQIGEPAYLAEALEVPVVSDFRPSDMALGGEAAPFVPYPDLLLYGEKGVSRAIHNIGGISNLTYLPADLNPEKVLAFDTGPGNALLDEAAGRLGLQQDTGGTIAASGKADPVLVERWLTHPYFGRKPPKSTGREVWNLETLDEDAALPPANLLATLTEFTARSIAMAYQNFVLPHGLDEIWVAGGGAYNATLMQHLRTLLPVPVYTFEEKGLDSKHREALCFAILGYLRYLELPNILKQTTGAQRDAIAGKITLPSTHRSQ